MIRLTRAVADDIIEHAKKDTPVEACGYLAGRKGIITKSYRMKNIDNSPEHFSFDREEQFDVVRKVRSEGLEIIANYHSHPVTPARPSQEDINLAYDPDISYLIVSLAGDREDIKSFSIKESVVKTQEIKIINDLDQKENYV
jgi:proteasome lid subunit RPN8/RPN11